MSTAPHAPRRLVPLAAVGAMALAAVLVPPAAAAEVTHTIAQVQGDGGSTPLAGQTVTVQGVVTADHRDGGYSGLYVQTAGSGGTEDATPGASDGIFVYLRDRTTAAQIGDLVEVTGTASEYYGLTQVNASGAADLVQVVETGAELPEPVPLPDTLTGTDREQYEGMLVAPDGDYLVASLHEADRYGSVWLAAGDTLPVKSTAQEPAGPDADAIAADNAARIVILDDGRSRQVTGTTQPYLTADTPVRTGDALDAGDLAFVLHYGYDRWRLQPTTPISASTPADEKASFTSLNPRPAAPQDVGGDVVVAAFNVLNYFTTFSTDDPLARGARNAAQLEIQRAKIVAAITALGADVVALQEIENSVHFGDGTPDVALADLVAGLNDAEGEEAWAYVPTPAALVGDDAPPTDPIMNAIIYRTGSVTPVGESVAQVDEDVWDIAREPIAQAFAPADGGAEFVVVANHFKSKGGGPEGEPDPADGQGWFNAERVEQAEAVAAFVTELAQATGTDDVVVLGDLNSYRYEDPMLAFGDAGLVDLVATHAPEQYTYTYDGEQGSLDHALGTASLADRVTGVDVWDINADEWFGYQYYGSYPEVGTVYRSSDHDPIVVGLATEQAEQLVEIDLLAITDFHGRLEANRSVAGAAVLAGAVDELRTANPNTLFVSAGDNIGASTFTSFVQQDTPTIEALNAMGLDVSALGNHEFDQGRVDLDDRVVPMADFPYLAANVYDRDTGAPAFEEYWLTEVDGVTVGFIGAVTQDLPTLVTPAGIATLEVRDVVAEVDRVADALSDGDPANDEADVLVLLVHEGPATADVADSTDDSAFGRIATGVSADVDAIFAGHTHRLFVHTLPVDGWAEGLGRPVVGSGQYGEHLGHITLTVDPATGAVVDNAATTIPLAGEFEPDPAVAEIVAGAVAVADELGAVSLGEITADVNRARQPGDTEPVENRGGESTLGNLVADVQLWATQEAGAQIAFMNPGGLRDDLRYASSGPEDPDGNVTFREAANVQPFANTLVTMTLTGAQVVDVLEEQWQPDGASRPFLKLGVAGLAYTYDPAADRGARITDVLVGGEPLDPAGEYVVVANSFLASGGDNFATLAEGADPRDSGRVDLQAFVDYMAEFSPVGPDLAQRAVGISLDVPADGFAPGSQVTVELSSLLFSAGEEQGDEVTLSIDGEQVATATIDPTVVPATDEVGRATVTFTVPVDAATGDLPVVVAVPSTGTTAVFTVPVAGGTAPACVVEYDAVRLWPNILLGTVEVTNTGTEPAEDWELTWEFTQKERVKLAVGATVRQRGSSVTATGWWPQTTIRPGSSARFAFLGIAPRGVGAPSGFTLNGVDCTTG